MNNTIPFHSAPHAPQITVDVNILSMLKQAASCLSEMASENVYLAAIGPDMELTIIMEEDAPSVLPCFDEGDALIAVKGAPLFMLQFQRFGRHDRANRSSGCLSNLDGFLFSVASFGRCCKKVCQLGKMDF